MPEPIAFFPLNARYKAAEKENRWPDGTLGDVAITNGPYNEPGGAYLFYGTDNSYIVFQNKGGLSTLLSNTLMCWIKPGGQDGPLFELTSSYGPEMWIKYGKLVYSVAVLVRGGYRMYEIQTPEVLPTGKWVHVASSYDNNTGNNSLYTNGRLRATKTISRVHEGATAVKTIRMGSRLNRNNHFKGKIAEMKVYDVGLNEAQIQTSIRQGSCTFPVIVVSLPSPMIS